MFGKTKINDPYNTMGTGPARGTKPAAPRKRRRTHWDQMPLPEVRAMSAAYEQINSACAQAIRTAGPAERQRITARAERDLNALRDQYDYDGTWRC